MAKSSTLSKSNFDEVHGYERQFAIVRDLPRLEQTDTLQKLQALATLTEGSAEWTALRNEIVVGNLYFAYTVGNRYAVKFPKIADDCIQWASYGLQKAVEDYCKHGNGSAFLPYAKTAIVNCIRRKGITPSVKCGITHSRNDSNVAHNAKTDAKRQANGQSAIESVLVVSDATTDENGGIVSVFDAMPSDTPSPLERIAERERDDAYEKAVQTLLTPQDASIWRLRVEQKLDWHTIGQTIGLNKSTAQMRFYSAKQRIENYFADDENR